MADFRNRPQPFQSPKWGGGARPRVRVAPILLVLLLAGCALPGSACARCADLWQAEGVDPAFAAALAARADAPTREPMGLAFADPNLTAAWGPRYALTEAAWWSDRNGTAKAAIAFGERAEIRVETPESWNASQARAALHALLVNASPGDAARESSLAAALDANLTARFGAAHRVAQLEGETRVAALWSSLRAPIQLTGNEDHYLDHGDPVARGSWHYAFAFPMTTLHVDKLDVRANPRGAYVLLLDAGKVVDQEEARSTAQAALGSTALPKSLSLVPAR